MRHTGGKWQASKELSDGCWEIFTGPVSIETGIASVWATRGEPYESANAYLIAAAPDLFEACKDFVRKVEVGEARSTRSYNQMKQAIAKAEGETL